MSALNDPQPVPTDEGVLKSGAALHQPPQLIDSDGQTTAAPTLTGDQIPESQRVPDEAVALGGFKFWMIFTSLMVATFLSAIELTSVATALPRIIEDLHGTHFVWVGSAYALGETAVLPLIGGIAQIWGRRPVVLGCLLIFTLGSGICGGAKDMNMMIGGRTVQGIGGGGILAMSEIIVADLVPLAQRGTYLGLIAAVWSLAFAIGPPVGGALADANWRWLFWLNLPLCGIAIVLVLLFMNLKTPKDDFKTKIRRMDWIGNFLVIAGTTISVIALTWAGVEHPWKSAPVLVPLILGIVLLVIFMVYEAKYASEPVIPWQLVSNRTSLMGYMTVGLQGWVAATVFYYLPTYFQGALGQSPIHSGTSFFGIAFTVAPSAIIAGATITKFNVYRPQHMVGWALTTIGIGLLTLLTAESSKGKWIGFQLVAGPGIGILYMAPGFPILAPIPVSENAHALALLTFVRTYTLTWGITVGATVLQNQLKSRLPTDFLAQFPSGVEISYSIIPTIHTLEPTLRRQVEDAFAKSIRIIWFVQLGFCGAGFLSTLLMKEVPMHQVTAEEWGIEHKEKKAEDKDVEKEATKADI